MLKTFAAASAAFALTCAAHPASAAVIVSGLVDENGGAGTSRFGLSPGLYQFTASGPVLDFIDVSATLYHKWHVHADDESWSTGTNFNAISWGAVGYPDPTLTVTSNGFILDIRMPESTEVHSDGCYFPKEWYSCGYTEYNEYAFDFYSVVNVGAALSGTAWTIEYSAHPPASAVPEPKAWALALVGFLLLGGALRSARRPSSTRRSEAWLRSTRHRFEGSVPLVA